MSNDIQELLAHGLKMADQMGQRSAELFYSPITVQTKKDKTFVTNADKGAEQLGRDYLALHRPKDGVWGEEFGKTFSRPLKDDITWIFDPIDGTKGFMDGISIWTNLLAAFRGDKLLFGIINNPITGERFWGGPDLPSRYSYIDPKTRERVEIPIRCADVSSTDQLMWRSTTKDYMDPPDRRAFDALAAMSAPREGGDAMIYAALARGRTLNVVYDGDMASWDIAAPAGVVLGAKGLVTDAYGKPIDFFREGKTTVLAAATKPLHEAVLNVFEAARRPIFEANPKADTPKP